MYTNDFAEVLKKDVGKKWRPSNGHEGELFFDKHCYKCKEFSPDIDCCEIHSKIFYLDIDDNEYPSELCIGCNGQPTCTKFDPKQE
jgi:hypothetical protein